jgi:two-component system NtrC family sensor kinase
MPIEEKLGVLCRLSQALARMHREGEIATAVLQIAGEALQLGDSEFLLLDEARQELYVVAQHGRLSAPAGRRLSLSTGHGAAVAAACRGRPVYVSNVSQDARKVGAGLPPGSELAVPIRIQDRLMGVLHVESEQRDAFDRIDQQLLCVLASQAALALDNARATAAQHRRAEELAAVNRVAREVTASLDLRQTLDTVTAAAAELIPCALAEISLWDAEREVLVLQALRCEPRRQVPLGRVDPPGHGYTGWVVRHRRPLLVPDVAARSNIRPHLLPGELPFAAYLGLPLLAGDELIGTLVLVDDEKGAFDDDDLSLLEELAGQAAAAIRNARLYGELAGRHNELAALYAVASIINQPLPLGELIDQVVAEVREVMRAEVAGVRLLDPFADLTVASSSEADAAVVEAWRTIPLDQAARERLAQLTKPEVLRDVPGDPRLAGRAFVVAPLCVRERVVGVLGVSTGRERLFAPEELALLSAIGHQLAMTIENTELAREALEAERMAAVGRVASTVAHELRSPLGAIIRSAEFLARPELSADTRHKLSHAVVTMAQRLNAMAQEILDYTRGRRMVLQPTLCDLPDFLERTLEVLQADFSDRGIGVVVKSGYTGEIEMDPERMAQVVYNLAANARDAMPQGGTLTITTRAADGWVEMCFADTGPGVAPGQAERIFEPFVSFGKREGAGLGLSIARRIVQEHGGDIHLESPPEGGAVFVVRLPLSR